MRGIGRVMSQTSTLTMVQKMMRLPPGSGGNGGRSMMAE
jgi:hypothetical protein